MAEKKKKKKKKVDSILGLVSSEPFCTDKNKISRSLQRPKRSVKQKLDF